MKCINSDLPSFGKPCLILGAICLIVSISPKLLAQQAITDFAIVSSDEKWINFVSGSQINPTTLFQTHKDAFGLSTDDQMIITKESADEFGISHYRYSRHYNGIEVLGNAITVHAKNGFCLHANGRVSTGLAVNTTPAFSIEEAEDYAIDKVKEEEALRLSLPKSSISLLLDTPSFRTPELVIVPSPDQSSFRLCYRTLVHILLPSDKTYMLLQDAHDLSINSYSGVFHSIGSVLSTYNGVQQIQTKWTGSVHCYQLIDETRGGGITTKIRREGVNQYLDDCDNHWNDDNEAIIHASAHWAAAQVWDFFYAPPYNRNGPHNDGSGLDLRVDAENIGELIGNSASPSSSPLEINLVGPIQDVCNARISIGSVGHEFTHGILSTDAGYNPLGFSSFSDEVEARALMEGLCDVFGEMVENQTNGSPNWLYGAFEFYNQVNWRTFSPPVFNGKQAMSYQNSNWLNYPGSHNRSGVLLHWFYLLSVGGAGTNHLAHEYCIDPLGIEKIGQFIYSMVVNGYFNTSSTFQTIREASIEYATQQYGVNSNEVAQIAQAWYAVGVGDSYEYPVIFYGHSVAGNETINRTNDVVLKDFQNNSGNSLTITSESRISIKPSSRSYQGSYFHAMIQPACNGSARMNGNMNQATGDPENIDSINSQPEESQNAGPKIIPNPNNGTFQVQYAQLARVEIYTSMGQKERTLPANGRTQLQITGLSASVYILRIYGTDGTVNTEKVVVQ